jgi:hypothetical protein
MKILIILIIFPFIGFSQRISSELPRIEKDTLYTSSGFKVVDNGKIKIGTGSTDDGSFKFIRISATSLFQYTSNNHNSRAANDANSLPRSSSGLEYKVVRIDKRGSKKHGFVYYPIINVGATRYEVDIENAIPTGEIVVPDEFKPKKQEGTVIIKQENSLADEIAKLKKLYDDGTLSKEEYEAAKKKLLEKQ